MYIYHYTSNRFEKTDIIEADIILGSLDLDEMTDEERELMRNDEVLTMCNLITKDHRMISIPWKFIIEINEKGVLEQ